MHNECQLALTAATVAELDFLTAFLSSFAAGRYSVTFAKSYFYFQHLLPTNTNHWPKTQKEVILKNESSLSFVENGKPTVLHICTHPFNFLIIPLQISF